MFYKVRFLLCLHLYDLVKCKGFFLTDRFNFLELDSLEQCRSVKLKLLRRVFSFGFINLKWILTRVSNLIFWFTI